VLSILRIVIAILFMQHGGQKLFAIPGTEQTQPFPLFSLMGVAGTLELSGGLLILLGLFTRPVAFILSGEMATAYFMAHAPLGFWPLLNDGEQSVLFCFVFLYMSVAGGGPWSLDQLRRRQRT
jgi:putative oxidoreductase